MFPLMNIPGKKRLEHSTSKRLTRVRETLDLGLTADKFVINNLPAFSSLSAHHLFYLKQKLNLIFTEMRGQHSGFTDAYKSRLLPQV